MVFTQLAHLADSFSRFAMSVCLRHWMKFLPTLPSGPSWSISHHVCLSVCMSVCMRHRVQFFSRPLIDPQKTWPDPSLSLVNPPSPPWGWGAWGGGGGWGGGGLQWASRPKLGIFTKILFLLNKLYIFLKMSPRAQKPAFLTYFMIFFLKNYLWKDLRDLGSFLLAVG